MVRLQTHLAAASAIGQQRSGLEHRATRDRDPAPGPAGRTHINRGRPLHHRRPGDRHLRPGRLDPGGLQQHIAALRIEQQALIDGEQAAGK
ncbi:hypothetical protein, partial [Cyanobium sp. Morenito 9A2]|uniref:hypothetical protein n=1 Tax=Cyanobium sp. Morenito 9A2 TaxID=2823718 RepID=UPI0020CE9904